MESTALPLGQQFIVVLFGPPTIAILWWLASRGFGGASQGGAVSGRTKVRQKKEFWILLAIMYLLGFGIMLYGHFGQT